MKNFILTILIFMNVGILMAMDSNTSKIIDSTQDISWIGEDLHYQTSDYINQLVSVDPKINSTEDGILCEGVGNLAAWFAYTTGSGVAAAKAIGDAAAIFCNMQTGL